MQNHRTNEGATAETPGSAVRDIITSLFVAERFIRLGIASVNKGELGDARRQFEQARAIQTAYGYDTSLPGFSAMLAACLTASGNHEDAEPLWNANNRGTASATAAIRSALAIAEAGYLSEAINRLHAATERFPDEPEIQVQLGLLLARAERTVPAEEAFRCALELDENHSDALVNLALCLGMRHAPLEAVHCLQRAQRNRPYDARIGLLLTLSLKAAHGVGKQPDVLLAQPAADGMDQEAISTLAAVITREPEFVDAFMSIPLADVDASVYAVLLQTLETALEREPEHAELHYHCGRVLERLGRHGEAIASNEKAVALKPRFTRALIELGKLYESTDQTRPAVERLEEAVQAGADFADIHFLLGNLYRRQGDLERARTAYHRALTIKDDFDPARQALASLPQ